MVLRSRRPSTISMKLIVMEDGDKKVGMKNKMKVDGGD